MRELFRELGLHYIERTLFDSGCEGFQHMEKTDYDEYNADLDLIEANIAKYSSLIRSAYMAPIYVK